MSVVDGHAPQSVAQALAVLQSGGLVGLPTETVYGLAADACNTAAVTRIYAIKGRPPDHPLIVHIASMEALPYFAAEIPPFAQRLADAFWPGPLTLILPRKPEIATQAAGGQDSIGVRCPSHPVAQAVLRACLDASTPIRGLAAPSANPFGRISPTTAAHVQESLGPELLVLDGGACSVGIESTIVDCTRKVPVLLRPGAITRARIEQCCGMPLALPGALRSTAPRASGTLEAHYAPRAPVRLMDAKTLQTALDVLGADARNIAVYARSNIRPSSAAVVVCKMPQDAQTAARQLFASLRALDASHVKVIWIETPPETAEWEGVRDRLTRAAAAG